MKGRDGIGGHEDRAVDEEFLGLCRILVGLIPEHEVHLSTPRLVLKTPQSSRRGAVALRFKREFSIDGIVTEPEQVAPHCISAAVNGCARDLINDDPLIVHAEYARGERFKRYRRILEVVVYSFQKLTPERRIG